MKIAQKLLRRSRAGILIGFSWVLGLGMTVAEAAPPYGSPGSFQGFHDNPNSPYPTRRCVELTNYQLRQRVGQRGYVNIFLGGDIGRLGNVEVKGTLEGKVYLLEVDKCSGKIEAANLLGG